MCWESDESKEGETIRCYTAILSREAARAHRVGAFKRPVESQLAELPTQFWKTHMSEKESVTEDTVSEADWEKPGSGMTFSNRISGVIAVKALVNDDAKVGGVSF